MQMHTIINNTVDILGLRKPYKIVLKPSLKYAAEYSAVYRKEKLCYHIIRVNLGNLAHDARCLNTLVVHELIHAWQEERGLLEIHGYYFRKMARILGQAFGMSKIYMPGVDKP